MATSKQTKSTTYLTRPPPNCRRWVKCFSTLSSQSRNGACPHCNGVRSQIGSTLIRMATLACPSPLRDHLRGRAVSEFLRRRFPTQRGEKLIFGDLPLHGERVGDDIIQSLMFTCFLATPDIVIDKLNELVGAAFESMKDAGLQDEINNGHVTNNIVLRFDQTIAYSQLLQQYTQARPRPSVPEYVVTYDTLKPHAPIHRVTCRYSRLSTTGSGHTVKLARNIAAFERDLLRCPRFVHI
jgi:Double-stranded RNA binding motif